MGASGRSRRPRLKAGAGRGQSIYGCRGAGNTQLLVQLQGRGGRQGGWGEGFYFIYIYTHTHTHTHTHTDMLLCMMDTQQPLRKLIPPPGLEPGSLG